jgi:hypothetical protein
LEKDGAQQVYEEVRYTYESKTSSHQGIVGVCSIRLKPGSCYIDQLQPASRSVSIAKPDTHPIFDPIDSQPAHVVRENAGDLKREQCPHALGIYDAVITPAELEYARPRCARPVH